ncbi:MAG: hypothetical protein Q8L90_05400 [Bacteroidota bacterium]|nr:hypothetical protein [Bacteroidota bacterium]
MNIRKNLKKKYIAYLDVLGFKEIVGKGNLDTLELYFSTVQDTLEIIRSDKKNIKSLLISDSTILISPDTREDFRTLVRAVQTIQAKLAQKDIWMRGSISFGEVYFNRSLNLVVGEGLVKAYLLESEAVQPRVIIDTSIIPKIAENRQDFYAFMNPHHNNFEGDKVKLIHNWQRYTEDDSFFVAYAHRILLDSIEDRSINLIYQKIKNKLYSDPKHYKKFLWVKNYFMEVLIDLEQRWEILSLNSSEEKENRLYIKEWWEKFTEL